MNDGHYKSFAGVSGTAGTLALIAGFFIGVGMGAEVDIIAFLMARYFGLRSLGTSFAYGFASYGLAGALGVYLMGAGFDRMHSYSFPLGGFFMIMVLAVALLSQLGPYRYSAPHAENDRHALQHSDRSPGKKQNFRYGRF